MHRTCSLATDSAQCSNFSSSFFFFFTSQALVSKIGTWGVTVFDWHFNRHVKDLTFRLGGLAPTSSAPNLFSQNKHEMPNLLDEQNFTLGQVSVALSSSFARILQFIGADLWCSLFKGFDQFYLVQHTIQGPTLNSVPVSHTYVFTSFRSVQHMVLCWGGAVTMIWVWLQHSDDCILPHWM